MRKLVVLAAVCAGVMLFASSDSARADHRPGGFGYGSGLGGSYGGGYGGYGGIGSSRYGSDYCPHDSYGRSGGSYGRYGSRYIDPYHGVRLRDRAYDHYDSILRPGSFGLYFGR